MLLVKQLTKTFLKHAVLYINRRYVLKRPILALLRCFPKLNAKLRGVVASGGVIYAARSLKVPTKLIHLTPRARQIYTNLKKSIADQQKDNH